MYEDRAPRMEYVAAIRPCPSSTPLFFLPFSFFFGSSYFHHINKIKKLTASISLLPTGSFTRKVLKPITLSNGQVIPAGCLVEVASHSVMNDPAVVADPEVFDPLRFYRMREQEGLAGLDKAGAGATNQFVSVNPTNLTFGYGRHACPGRFFAANEVKMIIGRALLDYDVKLLDGVTERYPNIRFADSVSF